MKLKLNATQEILLLLIALSMGAIIKNFNAQIFLHLIASVGGGLLFFYILKKISKQNKNIWNTLISCLIIFLILHYGQGRTDALITMMVTLIMLLSKFFLKYKGGPIFNPVVFSLFVLQISALFIPTLKSNFASWWGASYSFWPGFPSFTLILIAIWIVFSFKKWRKWWILISYLLTMSLAIIFLYKADPSASGSNWEFLKSFLQGSTTYFFAAIMLAEPRTSPLMRHQQIIYGTLAGIFMTIYLTTNFPFSSLLAILVPNLYFFILKWRMLKKTPA